MEIQDNIALKNAVAVRMGTNADAKQFTEYAESMTRETRRQKAKIKEDEETLIINALLGNK